MTSGHRKVAVVGAGVIGQVYAGRLADAGCQTWLLARGETFAELSADGVRLHKDGVTTRPPVTVVDSTTGVPDVDAVYLAVRADQVGAALPTVAGTNAPVVVSLVNLAAETESVGARIGSDRIVYGFPGVGGTRTPAGVTYHEVDQQSTTIGRAGGRERGVVTELQATGLKVEVVADMVSWLATHAVFIAGIGAAILEAGGSEQLGNDHARATQMVLAVRDGFNALARQGTTVTPTPLRIIFTMVPRIISVPYWQRQLCGDLGRLALAPHVIATRDTEFRQLVADVRKLTDNAPRLEAAFSAAGFPAEKPGAQEIG